MAQNNGNLNGSAPDTCPVALLLVDVINPLDFPEADQIEPHALAMAEAVSKLKKACRHAGIPTIYANDNFGRWRSDLNAVVKRCLEANRRGRAIAELLKPDERDYFVLKPKHSAFYSTTLDVLLENLGTETLIIGGMAGNICVLFTANDAYMRDYRIVVPADCLASNTASESEAALLQMRQVLKADVRPSTEWSVKELLGKNE